MGHGDRLDREATRRVIRRASAADAVRLADGSVLTEALELDAETVVSAAVEAGIAEPEIRRALALERLGTPVGRRRGDRLLGAAAVTVDDEVAGAPGDVLARLDAWLVSGHHLRRDRLRAERGVWRRRSGLLGATFRTVRRATGEGQLGELARIEAVAADTGSGTSAVRVTADRRRDRVARTTVGVAVAAAGTVVVAGLAVVTAPVVVLAAPLALAAGTGVAASGRRAADDVAIELARVLDAVGHADLPVRLGPDVVRRVVGRTAVGRSDPSARDFRLTPGRRRRSIAVDDRRR